MRKLGVAMACGALAIGMSMMADPEAGVAAGSPKRSVSIEQRQFAPRELTVNLGDEVTWTNRDGEQVHSVTADDGSFASGLIGSGHKWRHTFTTPGTYTYHCTPHPFMKGTVIVR